MFARVNSYINNGSLGAWSQKRKGQPTGALHSMKTSGSLLYGTLGHLRLLGSTSNKQLPDIDWD